MNKLKCSWSGFLVILPVILLEWRQLDIITAAFLVWTFAGTYHSMCAANNKYEPAHSVTFPNSAAAFFILLAHVTACMDIRFIHISDNIPIKVRYDAVAGYALFWFFNIFLIDAYYKAKNSKRSGINRIAANLIYLTSIASMLTGQLAMNSRLSIAVISPAVFLCFIELIRYNMNYRCHTVKLKI